MGDEFYILLFSIIQNLACVKLTCLSNSQLFPKWNALVIVYETVGLINGFSGALPLAAKRPFREGGPEWLAATKERFFMST